MSTAEKIMMAAVAGFSLCALGVTPDTEKWQRAIDEKSAAGGGVIEVPAGDYVVGSLMLKDNVELRLAKGARLLGAVEDKDYVLYDNPKGDSHASVVWAVGATNVAVTGEGTIDGRGGLLERRIFRPGGKKFDWRQGRNVLYFQDCRDVRVEGVFLTQPSSWTCFFRGCDGVVARKVRIYSHCNTSNDGFDVESRNVLIEDCDVDSEDDSLAIKSREPDRVVENVTVRRCRFSTVAEHIKFGTETFGVTRHVRISDCQVGCRTAPKFRNNWLNLPGVKTKTAGLSAIEISLMDGGRLEDVEIRDITIGTGVITPICIRYGNRSARVGEGASWMKDILIENVKATAPSESSIACSISGTPSTRPQNITLRNVDLIFKGGGRDKDAAEVIADEREKGYPVPQIFRSMLPAYGFYIRHVDGLKFENVKLHCLDPREARPDIVTVDASDFVRRRATRVQLWFDTEDYTCEKSNDAIRDLANIMTDEGVRGHFNVVGYLARFLLDNRRFDVVEALKPHVIGTQTLYHSRHPNITELTDLADYDEAYRLCLAEEAEGLGYLRAAFGCESLFLSAYPGNGSSYVALDVHSDLGAHFQGGLGAMDLLKRGDAVWYQNMRQIIYNGTFSLENLIPGRSFMDEKKLSAALDKLATYEAAVISMHPDMAYKAQHWDIENFLKGNLTEFGKWNKPAVRDPLVTRQFYANFQAFIRRIKADSRFEFTDCERLLATQKPRATIVPADVPAIRAALLKSLGPVEKPASWSVADCFQAAVRFLRGEKESVPGKVYGFLEKPVGVTSPVTLKTADLRAAAQKIVFKRHLPVSYDVGGVKIGPADFLYAALEVLETGAETVTVKPRDQLGDLEKHLPQLAKFRHLKPGWCIYWPQFKDEYLSDRLHWQYWTMRYE